jgi:GAF domain-containing protein/signal transduction histidine kinase/ActR/RegA family two-component response regulator
MLASRRPILIPDVKSDDRYTRWPGSEPVRAYIGVPLVVRDRVIGQLAVDKHQPDYYDEGDAELVFTFAQQAAIAIENARLFELTRRQSERLAQTLAVSETLHRGLELEQVLGQIAQGAVGLGFRRAVINVYQPEEDWVKVQATAGLEETERKQLMGATYRWSDFQTLMQERFQISRSYLIRHGEVDLERDFQGVVVTPRMEEQERGPGYWLPENLLLVPLWGIPSELLGVLSVDEPVNGLLPDLNTIWSLEAFANQAAIAIENAQLFAGEQHQREIAESLREVSSVLNASLDLDTVLTRIMEQLRRVVEYDSAGVLLEDGAGLLISAGLGFPEPDAIIGQRISLSSDDPAVQVFKSRQSLVIADVKADPSWVSVPGAEHVRGWMGVPLLVRGQVIGILTVDSCQPGFYAEEHATIASAFATQAAIAIENARLYEAERARYREAEALRRAALTLTSTIALDRVFERILTELQHVVPYDSASVQLLKGDRLEIIGGRGFPNLSELLGVSFPARGDNPNALVLDSQEPVIVDDVRPRYPAFSCEPHAASNIRAWLGVPLLIGDGVIGMLALDKCQPGFYTEAHARAAMAYAAQAAIAIENARLYETERERLAEMERRNRELAALHAVAAAVSSSLDTNVVLRETLAQALETIEMESGGVYLLDETGSTLTLRICHNLSQDVAVGTDRLKVGEGLSGRVVQAGEPIVVEDLPVSPLLIRPAVAEAGYQTAVAVPLRAQDRILGTFFGISRQARRFSPQDLKLLVAIGDEMGMAVQNARLHQALQKYAAELEARVEARTAEVNREREQLLAVLENAGEAIVITDADGFMKYANPAWEELTGYNAAQAIRGKTPVLDDEPFPDFSLPIGSLKEQEGYGEEQAAHIYPTAADANEFATMRGTTQRQRIWRREVVGQRPHGTTYVVDLTVTPVFDDALQLANLVIIYRDVTRYKELDRIKSEFLSTAAHELRSPLTSLLGFSELLLLRKDLSDEERVRFLKYINDHAIHLKQLVDDLLDISRIESGASFVVKLEPLELYPLFEQEIRSWQEAHPDHTYQLYAGHDWPQVHADQDRIRQVLRNLLSNATKYSTARGTISVSAIPVGGYMEITLTDEGIGMTDEELTHIFEKFWRANASSTAVEGTGLGLVIVKHIVEQHGGQVWVESIKGKGTVVHFTLPLLERQTTVLIAEDEGGVREIEHRILTSNGIATLLASSGQQTLDLAQSQRPDLILLDLMMPGMSGRDVLQALKSNPATQHIPVLVVSARSSWQTIEESYMLGAVDFLTKPFEYEELLSRVRRALKIAASGQQLAATSHLTSAS